jgi:hypothetical protein
VDPLGAARLGLSASGSGIVVDGVVPAEGVEVGTVVGPVEVGPVEVGPVEVGGDVTEKLEPVTITTSAFTDPGSSEPTSIVLLVVTLVPDEVSPPAPPVRRPGSYPTMASPDIAVWSRRASPSSLGLE